MESGLFSDGLLDRRIYQGELADQFQQSQAKLQDFLEDLTAEGSELTPDHLQEFPVLSAAQTVTEYVLKTRSREKRRLFTHVLMTFQQNGRFTDDDLDDLDDLEHDLKTLDEMSEREMRVLVVLDSMDEEITWRTQGNTPPKLWVEFIHNAAQRSSRKPGFTLLTFPPC